MTTALDLIQLAARDAGVLATGQTMLGDDVARNLKRMNFMLAEWRQQRYLVYNLVDYSLESTGAVTYTVGPNGDFDTGSDQRPAKIDAAFFRQIQGISPPNQIDYPATIIPSWEDYSKIAMKQLSSFPEYLFLDTAFPLGVLRPYPVPQDGQWEIHLLIKKVLPSFTRVSATVNLPEEYMSAIQSNLAVRMATGYRLPVTQEMKDMAKSTRNVLFDANVQIPLLDMPDSLVGGGNYNIYSDSYD